MKKQNMQDERVVAQRCKINSEAYGILMIALLTSILIQQFLLNAPLEQYIAEFICFFATSIYVVVRHLMLGLNMYGEGGRAKRIPLVSSIAAGIAVTVVNGFLNYTRYAEHYMEDGIGLFIIGLVVTFISATLLAFAIQSFLYFLNKKKQERIQNQLDEDEKNG